ncbi:MAG: HAMP domain-containing protein, partial [Cyanobacteria bacterium Co-bin13]|nr:HAMP domain-containing protein [Cyanobacteria bacterium Co-bin13]
MKPFRFSSLQSILIVPFVLQLAGAVGLIGYLSYRNGQETVRDLSSQLRYEITARINQQLNSYVDIPHAINRVNASALLSGNIDVEAASGYDQLWEQAKIFPNTNLIYCGSQRDGSLIGVGRNERDRTLQLVLYNRSTGHVGHFYGLNSTGDRTRLQSINPKPYDARSRPWYKAAVARQADTWSAIYLDFDTELPTITASTPVRDRSGSLIGVCATDFILPAEMSTFLGGLKVGQSGKTFLMERSGNLVATSTREPLIKSTGGQVQYRLASESSDPLIRGTAVFLQQQFQTFEAIRQTQQLEFELNGQRQLVQVLPFNDGRGINWLIVVAVPKADFMGSINTNTRQTFGLYLLSLLGAISVGILTARWVIRPLLRLNAAAKDLTEGRWNLPPEATRNDEVGELARSFNQMAHQLQESILVLEARNADLQKTKDQLTRTNEQLEAVLNAVPGPISWVAADGTYLGINAYLARSLGLSPESIIGNSVGLMGSGSNYVDFVQAFLRSDEASIFQEVSFTVNGQVRDYLLAAQKYQHGAATVVVGIDVSELRQAQAALRQAEITNQAIVSAIPDLLIR